MASRYFRSIMQHEFIALDKYVEKVKWLRQFLEDIEAATTLPAICIYYDSQSAIGKAQSNIYNIMFRYTRHRHIIPLNNYSQPVLSLLNM